VTILSRLYSPIEVVGRVPAPRSRVFAVLAEPRTYPSWLMGAQRIRSVDPAFPARHSRFEHSVGPAPAMTIDDGAEAVEADPPEKLALEVHLGPVRGAVEFRLEEDGDGTVLVFRERPIGAPAVLTPALRPILYFRNRRSLHRLRAELAR
jgi:uncharacterized protein YndB with AHSA1/START domain